MKNLKYYTVLAFSLIFCLLSCSTDDNVSETLEKQDIEEQNNNVQDNINFLCTDWGKSPDQVSAQMNSHELKKSNSGFYIYKSKESKNKDIITYYFVNNSLTASLLLTKRNTDFTPYLSEYTYIGEINDTKNYVNKQNNSIATIYDDIPANTYYCALGFTPYESEYYKKLEPIVITLDEIKIESEKIILSASFEGAKNVTETGFFIGKKKDALIGGNNKYATKAESPFAVELTNLENETDYYYCAYIVDDDTYYYSETESFTTPKGTRGSINGHYWIDLGLPSGTLWAECNVGASSIENYGGFYSWGETDEKTTYYIDNYKFFDYFTENLNMVYKYVGKDIGGTDLDVAYVKWGNEWKMPTLTQWQELFSKCEREFDEVNNVKGIILTGPNKKTLFIPAGGNKGGEKHQYKNEWGYYWTSECEGYSHSVYQLYFNEKSYYYNKTTGVSGYNVRAVVNK